METISITAEILASVIDAFVIVYFLNNYFEVKYKHKILVSICGVIPLYIGGYYFSDYFLLQSFFQLTVNFVYAILFLKGSKIKKLIADFIIVFAMAIISITSIILLTMTTGIPTSTLVEAGSLQRILILIISKLLLVFTAYFILHAAKESIRLNRNEWILVSAYFLATTIISIMLANITVNVEMSLLRQIQMMMVTGLLLLISIISLILVGRISQDKEYQAMNKILEVQLAGQKVAMIKAQKMHEKTRMLKHDINRYYSIVLDMLKTNRVNEVIEKIEDMLDVKNENSVIYIAKNDMINAVLNEKIELCHTKNITFEINVLTAIATEKELEIAIMISNILDNAMEAELNLKGERMITVEIFGYKGMYNLIVKNNIEDSVLKNNPDLKTNKKNKNEHGIGILSIKETVRKLDGNFECYEENNQFALHIMIPN